MTNCYPLQTSTRPQEAGGSFAARRGHLPQLSISDDSHHVTEAIGYMYDDDSNYNSPRTSRPSSTYTISPLGTTVEPPSSSLDDRHSPRSPTRRNELPGRRTSNDQTTTKISAAIRPIAARERSWEGQNGSSSPTRTGMRARAPSDTATTQFPLNDIDYESSPAAVAQELSNLQALRRMSMDVTATGDPDLPGLSAAGMPGVAPSPSDSEDDSSRLFWVPARLHPELAPKEFKSFLESKAEQIRRQSGELSSSSSDQSSRPSSLSSIGSGLRRKKSMLSRQIDNSNGRAGEGYQDGAERLELKRSISQKIGPSDVNLQELESLVTNGVPRLSLESPGEEANGDIILPTFPGSNLRRSTRTTYRKSSTKGKGERPYPKRALRTAGGAGEDTPGISSGPNVPPLPALPPVESIDSGRPEPETSASSTKPTTNFSRPGGRSPSPTTSVSNVSMVDSVLSEREHGKKTGTSPPSRQWQSKLSSHGKSSLQIAPENKTIPQIVETPPQSEEFRQPLRTSGAPGSPSPMTGSAGLPEKILSGEDLKTPATQRLPMPPKHPSSYTAGRPTQRGPGVLSSRIPQSLDQMSSHPSPLPGNDTNTGSLSFIPTLTEDKRTDNKKPKDKKEESKKSNWGWLLGKEEAEKDRRLEGINSKPKARILKPPERHDNTRLDVLQTSIDGGGKGRESLILERDDMKLEEERKKESQRKSANSDTKREKEGLFSSFFGGGKKNKGERDVSSKKLSHRGLSPEPPRRELKPDVDYNWTRFSILEERAIYRMAHIKLANPRRALYSQVLLSNFMYSYLAKVQQMHPQINLPTTAKQQQKKQQGKDQSDEFSQYQRYQQVSPSGVFEPSTGIR